ncbi:MAG TPA: hypothetical protein VFQ65_10230 [Kofleriaceae bacterium]|nr:hypothetical protein [Kofleriaceae bacterium]
MASWLRRFGVRLAFFCVLIAGMFATHLAVAKPRLPFVVFGTLDRAFTLAEQQQSAITPRQTLLEVLEIYEAELLVIGDAASDALDHELARLDHVAPLHRAAALACVQRHLELARADLVHATTPEEFREFDATCERLRDVRRVLAQRVLAGSFETHG